MVEEAVLAETVTAAEPGPAVPTPALRFLFITADEFPPFRPDVDILFARELAGRGHRIEWIMRAGSAESPSGLMRWRGSLAWIARTDRGTGRLRRLRKHVRAICNDARVFTRLRAGRHDFVQVKDKFVAALMAAAAARLCGVKFFFWLSFPYPDEYLLRGRTRGARYRLFSLCRGAAFEAILYRVIARRADHIFVQSEEMKRRMSLRGVPAAKMTAVPMGIDARGETAAEGASAAESSPQPLVVYLGTLQRARRLEFLLQSFVPAARLDARVRLRFIGAGVDPEDQPFLERCAARLGVGGQVEFTGFLPRAAAFAQMRTAAVCVSPIVPGPLYDVASPTKMLEYMALGRAVVVNDHPEQRRLVQDSGGGLCTAYDPQAFGAAIVWLLAHPREAQAMGARGREYVLRKRSYTTIADTLERRYLQLVGRSRSA